MTTLIFKSKNSGEILLEKDFDRVMIAFDRRAQTDRNMYLRINATKFFSSENFHKALNHFEDVEKIKDQMFYITVIYSDGKTQEINKDMYLGLDEFDPLSDGTIVERIVLSEAEPELWG